MKGEATERGSSIKVTLLCVAVTASGAMVAALAVARQSIDPQHAWIMMIALSLFVAPLSTVQIPGVKATLVLGDVITFSCAMLFGPAAAVIAAVADGAISSLRLTKNYRKFFYNVGTCAVSMAGATALAKSAFPDFGQQDSNASTGLIMGEAALLTLGYFLTSTVLIAAYIAFSNGLPIVRLWREKFLWTVISYVSSGASCAAAYLLVGRMGLYVFFALISIMLIVFMSYRFYFGKLDKRAAGQAA